MTDKHDDEWYQAWAARLAAREDSLARREEALVAAESDFDGRVQREAGQIVEAVLRRDRLAIVNAVKGIVTGDLVKIDAHGSWRTSRHGPDRRDLDRILPDIEPALDSLMAWLKEMPEYLADQRRAQLADKLLDDAERLYDIWQHDQYASEIAYRVLIVTHLGGGEINIQDLRDLGQGDDHAAAIRLIAAATLQVVPREGLPLSADKRAKLVAGG